MNYKHICKGCKHHLSEHSFASPKSLTLAEKKSGLIPWMCNHNDDCTCIEFIPGVR